MNFYQLLTFLVACLVTFVLWVWIVGLLFGLGYLLVTWIARRMNHWRRT